MPSNFVTTSGIARINAGRAGNITSSTTRAAGLNTKLNLTQVSKPDVMTGSSNDYISTSLVSGTGYSNNALNFAVGVGVNTPDQVRKQAEITTANANAAFSRGQNTKLVDREPLLQGSGLRQLRDGTWVNSAGVAVPRSGLTSNTGNYQIVAGSGDQSIKGIGQTTDFYYKVGGVNTEKNLSARTQY